MQFAVYLRNQDQVIMFIYFPFLLYTCNSYCYNVLFANHPILSLSDSGGLFYFLNH